MGALVSAELLKLQRQPGVLFWGFLAVPIASLFLKLALESVFYVRSGSFVRGETDMFLSAAQSLGIAGNPIGQLLYAIGVSAVFFTEYRFLGWRNLVPRAGRVALLVAKAVVCLLCIVMGLLMTLIGDFALNTVLSVLSTGDQSEPVLRLGGFLTIGAAFAIAFLELATLTAIVTALTILFRSMMAAIVPVFLLAFGTMVLQAYLGATVIDIPLPSLAADAARASLFRDISKVFGLVGFGVLAIWCMLATALAGVVFSRQELSVE